jgi:hypothetical protein
MGHIPPLCVAAVINSSTHPSEQKHQFFGKQSDFIMSRFYYYCKENTTAAALATEGTGFLPRKSMNTHHGARGVASLHAKLDVGFATAAIAAQEYDKKLDDVGDTLGRIEKDVGIIKNQLDLTFTGSRKDFEAVHKGNDQIIEQNEEIIGQKELMDAKLDALLERSRKRQGYPHFHAGSTDPAGRSSSFQA